MPALLPPGSPAQSTNEPDSPPIATGTGDPDGDASQDQSQPDPGVTLTSDQATAAGLTDAQPGDTFTATLTVKASDPTAGVTLDISDAKTNASPDDAAGAIPMPKQKTLGPTDIFGANGPGADY